jgi:ribosome-associated protein
MPARTKKPAPRKGAPKKSPSKAPNKARAPSGGKRAQVAKRPAPKSKGPAVAKSVVRDERAKQKALLAAKAGLNKKAEDVTLLDVRALSSVADYFVIMSGNGPRQVNALSEGVDEEMKKAGHTRVGIEGQAMGVWVLLDYGDVLVHIFEPEERARIDLEGNWADAPKERVEG